MAATAQDFSYEAVVELPFSIGREIPGGWTMLRGLKAQGEPAATLRYLHPGLEIRPVPGKGRGVIATTSIKAGEVAVLDVPLITGGTYEGLIDDLCRRTRSDAELRRQVLFLCGDPSDESSRARLDQAPSRALLENIVRHNYIGAETPPKDGQLTSACEVGLWPLASLLNHSLRPTVARSFSGLVSCQRLIRAVQPGDEVFDNYLDLRLPADMRRDMMRRNHDMKDEGPDEFDGPAKEVADIREQHEAIMSDMDDNCQEAVQAAAIRLSELTNRIFDLEVRDPALSSVFRDFGAVVARLGDAPMALQGLAQAIELATAREPYSVISYALALQMLHIACLARDQIDDVTRDDVEALVRKHFRMVFGDCSGAFEELNPRVMLELAGTTTEDHFGEDQVASEELNDSEMEYGRSRSPTRE